MIHLKVHIYKIEMKRICLILTWKMTSVWPFYMQKFNKKKLKIPVNMMKFLVIIGNVTPNAHNAW